MTGVGIDFGTTNSIMSLARQKGKTITTTPFYDKNTGLPHPSIVWYKAGEIIVGSEAKKRINTYANAMGNLFIHSIKSSLASEKVFEVFGNIFEPYEISSEIFKYLKYYAEKEYKGYLEEPINECVVTIPVSFTGLERKLLRKAAHKAGLHIKSFIHEPFAAVLWYMHQNKMFDGKPEQKLFLIFDWGGGTLDITLVQFKDNKLIELSNSGISGKSGDYFDDVIQKYALNEFSNSNKLSPLGINLDNSTLDNFKYLAEQEKINLSDKTTVKLSLPSFYQGKDLQTSLDRNTFESLIDSVIEEAYGKLQDTASGKYPSQIDAVLMIGGSSALPAINRKIRNKYGAKVVTIKNANSIISEGASLISFYNFKPILADQIKIKLYDDSYYTIFEKDLTIGNIAKEVKFMCTDNQDGNAKFLIFQGNEVKKIINIPVNLNFPQRYTRERIHAQFNFDEDLILNISARAATIRNPTQESVHDLRYGLIIDRD